MSIQSQIDRISGEVQSQSSLVEQIKTALNGKATDSGSAPAKEEQEKSVDITENGTTEVTPDEGKVLSKVSITVNVESSGGDGSDKFDASLDGSLTEINSPVTTTIAHCCRGLTELKTVNLPNATAVATYAFYGCTGITEVNLGKATAINSSAFYQCTSMTKLDCGASPNFGGSSLAYCSALTTLIIRGSKVPTLNSTTFSGISNFIAYIYVPSVLIDSYKTASNWSTYSARFRAIEDYPNICGG